MKEYINKFIGNNLSEGIYKKMNSGKFTYSSSNTKKASSSKKVNVS